MQTLEDIRAEYDRLDRLLGVDTSGIRLRFSKRMRRQYGVCVFQRNRPTEIRLAAFLQEDAEQLLMTARHEYAHAACALLTGQRHGHDAAWKQLCRRIGCPDSRLAPNRPEVQRDAAPRYIVRCVLCGAETPYYRRGKVVQAVMRGRGGCTCRRCGGAEFQLLTRREEP